MTLQIPTLEIADIDLPEELERLRDLVYDLWWSFNPKASRLFAWIDPEHWRRYHNPVELLINVDPHTWRDLLKDSEFIEAYAQAIDSLDASRRARRFMDDQPGLLSGPIAYFSMEFGLHESLGMYSGGLGVLAGDHCKAASDLGLPLFGMGLLYRSGYFRQTVDADGFQQHIYPDYDFARLPVRPVQAPSGGSLTVPVDLPGRVVHAQVWVARVSGVHVFFLDTDISLNDPSDRAITGLLYVRGREMRMAQELVLGVGGVRAIRALGLQPAVWHMNEGHVAMLTLERVRERVMRGDDFVDACASVRKNTVFTTHTPVPAGNEVFSIDLAKQYLDPWARDTGVAAEDVVALGAHEGLFNLTTLSIRLSSSTNGVSALHGQVSSNMWKHLWPAEIDSPIFAITNGVHTETWIGPEMRSYLAKELGADWASLLLNPEAWERLLSASEEGLLAARRAQKQRLIRYVRERAVKQAAREGSGPSDLRRLGTLLDPAALTIGFARRFATYKRAMLLLEDMDRAKALLLNPERPVQLIFAGKAHPADREGQEYIRQLAVLSRGELAGKIVFLEDYDIAMARMLVQGVDVWLNTPRKPLEASGTSGQKAAINGALNLSIADGWWAEGWNGDNGFLIDGGEAAPGPSGEGPLPEGPVSATALAQVQREEAQDHLDARALYRELETRVIPFFFAGASPGASPEWTTRMKASIASIAPRFSARRMVRDYLLRVYAPASKN
ncbi:MAG: alpha-glucan family phosphorylase [Vicinamibacteria bacterium]|nr:alpha-glucan family phosphorylase [Vicinamibacteria bacterium]